MWRKRERVRDNGYVLAEEKGRGERFRESSEALCIKTERKRRKREEKVVGKGEI